MFLLHINTGIIEYSRRECVPADQRDMYQPGPASSIPDAKTARPGGPFIALLQTIRFYGYKKYTHLGKNFGSFHTE